jgi:DNA-binding PadR family transcriptional regulator
MSDVDISAEDSVKRTETATAAADPLKPAVFHILLALADEPTHGYAVMQSVRAQSAGTVPLRTGSFYRHLSRLMDDGLVAEAPGRPADDDPRRGAYYRVTPRGLRVLARERARLAALVAAVDALRPASRRGPA